MEITMRKIVLAIAAVALIATTGPSCAQQATTIDQLSPAGPQPTPMFVPVPVLVPVPANGCVWAGRPFSDGSGFCVADKVMQTCNQGKWGREGASDGCHGALADTK